MDGKNMIYQPNPLFDISISDGTNTNENQPIAQTKNTVLEQILEHIPQTNHQFSSHPYGPRVGGNAAANYSLAAGQSYAAQIFNVEVKASVSGGYSNPVPMSMVVGNVTQPNRAFVFSESNHVKVGGSASASIDQMLKGVRSTFVASTVGENTRMANAVASLDDATTSYAPLFLRLAAYAYVASLGDPMVGIPAGRFAAPFGQNDLNTFWPIFPNQYTPLVNTLATINNSSTPACIIQVHYDFGAVPESTMQILMNISKAGLNLNPLAGGQPCPMSLAFPNPIRLFLIGDISQHPNAAANAVYGGNIAQPGHTFAQIVAAWEFLALHTGDVEGAKLALSVFPMCIPFLNAENMHLNKPFYDRAHMLVPYRNKVLIALQVLYALVATNGYGVAFNPAHFAPLANQIDATLAGARGGLQNFGAANNQIQVRVGPTPADFNATGLPDELEWFVNAAIGRTYIDWVSLPTFWETPTIYNAIAAHVEEIFNLVWQVNGAADPAWPLAFQNQNNLLNSVYSLNSAAFSPACGHRARFGLLLTSGISRLRDSFIGQTHTLSSAVNASTRLAYDPATFRNIMLLIASIWRIAADNTFRILNVCMRKSLIMRGNIGPVPIPPEDVSRVLSMIPALSQTNQDTGPIVINYFNEIIGANVHSGFGSIAKHSMVPLFTNDPDTIDICFSPEVHQVYFNVLLIPGAMLDNSAACLERARGMTFKTAIRESTFTLPSELDKIAAISYAADACNLKPAFSTRLVYTSNQQVPTFVDVPYDNLVVRPNAQFPTMVNQPICSIYWRAHLFGNVTFITSLTPCVSALRAGTTETGRAHDPGDWAATLHYNIFPDNRVTLPVQDMNDAVRRYNVPAHAAPAAANPVLEVDKPTVMAKLSRAFTSSVLPSLFVFDSDTITTTLSAVQVEKGEIIDHAWDAVGGAPKLGTALVMTSLHRALSSMMVERRAQSSGLRTVGLAKDSQGRLQAAPTEKQETSSQPQGFRTD